MFTNPYGWLFFASMILTVIYAGIWHRRISVFFTLIFVLIPICNFSYYLGSIARDARTAISAVQLSNMGGCFLTPVILLAILDMCHIRLKWWTHLALMIISSLVFFSSFTIGVFPIYYTDYSFIRESGSYVLYRTYGPMHTVYLLMIVTYFLISLCVMLYCYFKKTDVSNLILKLLFLPEAVCFAGFFASRLSGRNLELTPLTYCLAQVVYLIIAQRVSLYMIDDTAVDSLLFNGTTGFISFDFRENYLGSNERAKKIFPELREIKVDTDIAYEQRLRESALKWIRSFEDNRSNNQFHYEHDGRIYLVTVSYLFGGRHRRGYQLTLTDDTEDQKYISLLGDFNAKLEKEVAEKTERIEDMHDRLILGMAAMVDGRDNSTGGHIRRTSEVVRMLVAEIGEIQGLKLSDKFCRNLIKAAPMHDLGKIAVDDTILRKPGKFTPEEFEMMKKHAAEGARIVHEILVGTEDEDFHLLAENVAHYHHERWDGSGYPDGLKGEQIPLEARIMAIADVYDALVSKRVYKESMSFEKADAIIMEGMGRHFDKQLEPCYVKARPHLEAYYQGLDAS